MTAYDAQTRLAVVEALVDNPDLDAASQTCGLFRSDVLDIASHHGYPNFDSMMKAREVLAGLVRAANTSAPKPKPPTGFQVFDKAQLDRAAAAEHAERIAESVRPTAPRGATSAAAQELVDVPVDDLRPDEDNPREDVTADLDDLVASIMQAGLLQPIVAQRRPDGTLKIVAGHRRHAAVRLLGWSTVPTVVREEMGRAEVLAAMLIENSQRRDLDPIQEARAVQHLMTRHQLTSHAQVAAKVGKNQVWVSSRLSLLLLTPDDQRKVRAGNMTISEAVRRGRAESGRARGPHTSGAHLSASHQLAQYARQLCDQQGHLRGKRLAKTACGECWEQVIRSDERRKIIADSARTGTCACCDREMP